MAILALLKNGGVGIAGLLSFDSEGLIQSDGCRWKDTPMVGEQAKSDKDAVFGRVTGERQWREQAQQRDRYGRRAAEKDAQTEDLVVS